VVRITLAQTHQRLTGGAEARCQRRLAQGLFQRNAPAVVEQVELPAAGRRRVDDGQRALEVAARPERQRRRIIAPPAVRDRRGDQPRGARLLLRLPQQRQGLRQRQAQQLLERRTLAQAPGLIVRG
jgi:hypothetical protein